MPRARWTEEEKEVCMLKRSNIIETRRTGDPVVYKVPAAFALLFVVLVALRRIGA